MQFQKVKLVDGTADSSTVITAGNGVHGGALRVTIASDSTGQVALAAGTAEYGKLAAGSAIIGKVGIDQTTDGTTNKVAAVCTNAGTFAVQAVCTNAGTFAVQAAQATAGNLNMTEASASAIKTAVEVIDNCISGSEAQVDVVAALPAGTNNIGDVDVLSFASGKTIKRAVISGATSGNNTIVAAVADKKIKVLSVLLVAVTAVTVRFESGADGTALTGVMSLAANAGFVLNAPSDPTNHWFETGVNTLLNMELGGAVQVSGCITYYEEA